MVLRKFPANFEPFLCKTVLSKVAESSHWPNSPGPLTDDWKVTDNSSVNFDDKFFLHFLLKFSENEEKTCHEIYR